MIINILSMLFKRYLIIIETGEFSLEDRVIKNRGIIRMRRNIPSYVNCKWCKFGGGLCSRLITNPRSMRKWSTVSNYCIKYRMRYYVSKEGSNNSNILKLSIF
jgi:hypothetical protein